MSDKDFFDANGQVPPNRVDEFVRAQGAKRRITLTSAAGNAVAAQIARERAEAEGDKRAAVVVKKSASAKEGSPHDLYKIVR